MEEDQSEASFRMFWVDPDAEFPPGKLQVWVRKTDISDLMLNLAEHELEDKVKLAAKSNISTP